MVLYFARAKPMTAVIPRIAAAAIPIFNCFDVFLTLPPFEATLESITPKRRPVGGLPAIKGADYLPPRDKQAGNSWGLKKPAELPAHLSDSITPRELAKVTVLPCR